jgi:hypothetical protein
MVQLQEHEIRYLCTTAREIFLQQPILLELCVRFPFARAPLLALEARTCCLGGTGG